MKGSWLLEKAAARRALISSRDMEGSSKAPHGTKRKNNNPSEPSVCASSSYEKFPNPA